MNDKEQIIAAWFYDHPDTITGSSYITIYFDIDYDKDPKGIHIKTSLDEYHTRHVYFPEDLIKKHGITINDVFDVLVNILTNIYYGVVPLIKRTSLGYLDPSFTQNYFIIETPIQIKRRSPGWPSKWQDFMIELTPIS